jgi:hypothetical protein
MLNVILKVNENEVVSCRYIYLEPYAPNTGRKFTFSDFKSSPKEIEYNDIVNVDVSIVDKENKQQSLVQFDIVALNHSFYDELDEKWLYGNITSIGVTEFRQGLIDVFYTWARDEQFDWFAIPPSSSYLKLDYISACMIYDGIYTSINDKSHYTFDMSIIKEEKDFFYLASLEFIGERSYIGHDLHTFKDCFHTLHSECGPFKDKTVVFENVHKISDSEIRIFFDEIKSFFLKYGFNFNIVE